MNEVFDIRDARQRIARLECELMDARCALARAGESEAGDDDYIRWLEDELMECMRLASKGLYGKGQEEDEITDALRLHGIRLLMEADVGRYEALLERWQARNERFPDGTTKESDRRFNEKWGPK